MARVGKLKSFMKAFFAVLLGGTIASAATQREVEAWEFARSQNTPEAYYLYLSLFPAGEYVDEALAILAGLGTFAPVRGLVPVVPVQGQPGQQGGGGGGPYGG
jgi:hypothetical protein